MRRNRIYTAKCRTPFPINKVFSLRYKIYTHRTRKYFTSYFAAILIKTRFLVLLALALTVCMRMGYALRTCIGASNIYIYDGIYCCIDRFRFTTNYFAPFFFGRTANVYKYLCVRMFVSFQLLFQLRFVAVSPRCCIFFHFFCVSLLRFATISPLTWSFGLTILKERWWHCYFVTVLSFMSFHR